MMQAKGDKRPVEGVGLEGQSIGGAGALAIGGNASLC